MKYINYFLSASFLLPMTFAHAEADEAKLAGIYLGREWGLFKWGEPCEVLIHHSDAYNEKDILIYRVYSADIFLNINDTFADPRYPDAHYSYGVTSDVSGSSGSAEVESIMKSTETKTLSFTDSRNDIYRYKHGGKLYFENGELKQVYIWELGIPTFSFLPTFATGTCGLLEKLPPALGDPADLRP